jgi:hypothetical protein
MATRDKLRRTGISLALCVVAWAMGVAGAAARTERVVALDECDPPTFNAGVRPGTCVNVGGNITFDEALAALPAGHEDWLFLPAAARIKKGSAVKVTNQGGKSIPLPRSRPSVEASSPCSTILPAPLRCRSARGVRQSRRREHAPDSGEQPDRGWLDRRGAPLRVLYPPLDADGNRSDRGLTPPTAPSFFPSGGERKSGAHVPRPIARTH